MSGANQKSTKYSNSGNAEECDLENALTNGKHDNCPLNVDVTIDINDIYDGALKVLKRIRPFWPVNNIKFKVGLFDSIYFS